ncbi:hypothetical protein [Paenibacillus sp. MMS20-IR301]|uniref:hypothetical protein n=1 Tax=Paenibacillus sp. MMS20-IR301 TaxID=2895946 RepID=UPI0028E7301A|nr:hypothetical protein [Paenibacillus sp. MMS20-IR301]WNS45118.1 hypothetical protein LOS79_07575 [Paenibacillus sp. MMS20-IR301]
MVIKINKIKNGYYLLAGVLAILFAVTHAWNGETTVLQALQVNEAAMDTAVIFKYVWHIITAENLVFGIIFIILSLQGEGAKARFAAWTITSLLSVRLLVILGITAVYDLSGLKDTFIDSITILIYIAVNLLGMKVKKLESGGQVTSRR